MGASRADVLVGRARLAGAGGAKSQSQAQHNSEAE